MKVTLIKQNINSLLRKPKVFKIVLMGKSCHNIYTIGHKVKSIQHQANRYPLNKISNVKLNQNLCHHSDKHKNYQVQSVMKNQMQIAMMNLVLPDSSSLLKETLIIKYLSLLPQCILVIKDLISLLNNTI